MGIQLSHRYSSFQLGAIQFQPHPFPKIAQRGVLSGWGNCVFYLSEIRYIYAWDGDIAEKLRKANPEAFKNIVDILEYGETIIKYYVIAKNSFWGEDYCLSA
jgi:hypothetical protein